MKDPLTKAICDAGEELSTNHLWNVREDGTDGRPSLDGLFVEVMRKHLAPLVDEEGLKRARIEALKAELAELT